MKTGIKPKRLGTRLMSSSVVAGLVLVGAVLPAEYGIDPTGFGRMTGLTLISDTAPSEQSLDFGQTLAFNVGEYDVDAERIEQSIKGLISLENAPFTTETIMIEIDDLGEVEHKFIMAGDQTLVYSWEVLGASGDGVYFDFHGHPRAADRDSYPDGFEMAYSKSEGTAQSGAFTAPFGGLHGFYFMNLEEGPITIELKVSGYFESHREVYRAVDGEVVVNLDL